MILLEVARAAGIILLELAGIRAVSRDQVG
jgi:hypothetical protein